MERLYTEMSITFKLASEMFFDVSLHARYESSKYHRAWEEFQSKREENNRMI